jgi:hypothetical protein
MWQQLKMIDSNMQQSDQETTSAVQLVRQLVRGWTSIACSKQMESAVN